MPSITALTRIFFVSAACCALFACGKANDQAPALSSVNKHPDTWLTGHRIAYRQNSDQCRGCHGNELLGGITKIGCSTDSCHSGNHPPRDIIHPVPFKGTADLNKAHGGMAKKDLTICQDCHGTPGGGSTPPRFNLVYGSLPAGCESSGCHLVNMAHPKPWQTHSSSGNQANACALCHGANFEGSAASGAPSCKSCHTGLVAGVIPVAGQCVSCHGNPPNGTVTPNRAGSHAAHLTLPEMSGNCAACHAGGGSGAATHGTALTLAIAPGFSANSGAAASNGTTCSNISCHGGGLPTPAWGSSIDVSTACTICHKAGTPEDLSNNSGSHAKHSGINGITCVNCHDMTNRAAHFKNVTTKGFETLPSSTLRSYLNYDAQKSCTVTNPTPFTGCHSDKKSWVVVVPVN